EIEVAMCETSEVIPRLGSSDEVKNPSGACRWSNARRARPDGGVELFPKCLEPLPKHGIQHHLIRTHEQIAVLLCKLQTLLTGMLRAPLSKVQDEDAAVEVRFRGVQAQSFERSVVDALPPDSCAIGMKQTIRRSSCQERIDGTGDDEIAVEVQARVGVGQQVR